MITQWTDQLIAVWRNWLLQLVVNWTDLPVYETVAQAPTMSTTRDREALTIMRTSNEYSVGRAALEGGMG